MQPELIVLGLVLGAIGSALCVLLHDTNDVIANLIGGLLGGLFAAIGIGQATTYTTPIIALLILSGYVGGSMLHAIVYRTPDTGDGHE